MRKEIFILMFEIVIFSSFVFADGVYAFADNSCLPSHPDPDKGFLDSSKTKLCTDDPQFPVLCSSSNKDTINLGYKCMQLGSVASGYTYNWVPYSSEACLYNPDGVYGKDNFGGWLLCNNKVGVRCDGNTVGFIKDYNSGAKRFDALCAPVYGGSTGIVVAGTKWIECNVDNTFEGFNYMISVKGGFYEPSKWTNKDYYCAQFTSGTTNYESWHICPSSLKKSGSNGVDWLKKVGNLVCSGDSQLGWVECTSSNVGTSYGNNLCQPALVLNKYEWVECNNGLLNQESKDGQFICESTGWVKKEFCTNGIDDNEDGKVDCLDSQCFDSSKVDYCFVGGAKYTEIDKNTNTFNSQELNCNDGLDNDKDNKIDCLDNDCLAESSCKPKAPTSSAGVPCKFNSACDSGFICVKYGSDASGTCQSQVEYDFDKDGIQNEKDTLPCSKNAKMVNGACICVEGFWNKNAQWNDGCEEIEIIVLNDDLHAVCKEDNDCSKTLINKKAQELATQKSATKGAITCGALNSPDNKVCKVNLQPGGITPILIQEPLTKDNGNYDGAGKVGKNDITEIKKNPNQFWESSFINKDLTKLNKYVQKMVANWGK